MSTAIEPQERHTHTISEMVDKTGFTQTAFWQWVTTGQLSAIVERGRYMLDPKEVMKLVAKKHHKKKFKHIHSTT